MAVRELVLHVGHQQTGGRMLGRSLAQLRPQLHQQGVGVLGDDGLERVARSGGWRCAPGVGRMAARRFERGVRRLVDEELHAAGRRGRTATIVVSSDHLLGRSNLGDEDERRFRPFAVPSVTQLIRAVRPEHVRLVLYVRRQDRLMEACLLRALQNGGTQGFEERFPRWSEPVLDHGELLARLASIPEVAQVHVRPFELVGASAPRIADALLSTLGISEQLSLDPVDADAVPYRLYSARAAKMALDVNPHLDSPRERRLVKRFLLENLPGTDDRSTRLLPSRQRERILRTYAVANRRLFERWMPDLPVDSYADDPSTARLADACVGAP